MLGLTLFSPSPPASPRPTPRKRRKLRVEVVIPIRTKSRNKQTILQEFKPRDPTTGRYIPETPGSIQTSKVFMPWIAHPSDSEYDPGETTSTSNSPPYSPPKKTTSKGAKYGKKRRRSPSPPSPASSISLGSTWYEPPRPKRVRKKPAKAGQAKGEGKGKGKATEVEENRSVGVVRFRSTPLRSPSAGVQQHFDSEAAYYALYSGNKSRGLRPEGISAEPTATRADSDSPRMKGTSSSSSGAPESDEAIRVEQELWEIEMNAESEERLDEYEEETTRMEVEPLEPPLTERSPSSASEEIPPSLGSSPGVTRFPARQPSNTHYSPSEAGPSTAPGTNEWLRARGIHVDDTSSHETHVSTEGRVENEERASLIPDQNPPIKLPSIPTTPRISAPSYLHSTPTGRLSQRLGQLRDGLPPSSVRSGRSIGSATPQRAFDAEPTQQSAYHTPVHTSTNHGSRRSLIDSYVDPPATPLPQVNLEDPDIKYLSSVGLSVELDRLGTVYGFNREVVERVYYLEGGLSAAKATLEEMGRAMEGVLARRGT